MKNLLFGVLVGGAVWLLFLLGSPARVDVFQERTPQTHAVTSVPVDEQESENITERADTRMPLVATRGILVTEDNTVLVTRVVDGDTIEVSLNGKKEMVRLIGIDAPETVDPRKTIECFGKEASEKTKEILNGKIITLESDPTQGNRDKYGRLLRYVFINELNINKLMISEGFAHEYTYQSNPYKYQSEFENAQKQAKKSRVGLWSEDNKCYN